MCLRVTVLVPAPPTGLWTLSGGPSCSRPRTSAVRGTAAVSRAFVLVAAPSAVRARTLFRGAYRRAQDGMFPAENLRDWRDEKIIDPTGTKIGDLEAVYVDTATDQPAFATVRVGFIGRHRLVFVPLDGATVSPSAIRVRYDKKLVTEAPGIDLDGELAAADEPE